jgi:16S rRNA (uracil1498-N3)-methyltransferase
VRDPRRPDTPFWVEPHAVQEDRLKLSQEESHHLLRVHRSAPGAPFDAVDGAGNGYDCVLESIDDGLAVGRIVGRSRGSGELGTSITLLVGLPDSGPAEAVTGFAVPLGVSAIDFASCARSGRPPLPSSRLDRLARIARSACKQSRRSRLPEIRSSPSLASAVALLPSSRRFLADPGGAALAPTAIDCTERAVAIAVGPPGGFDLTEGGLLRSAEFQPISLGPSRLATDSASITLLAMVRNLLL